MKSYKPQFVSKYLLKQIAKLSGPTLKQVFLEVFPEEKAPSSDQVLFSRIKEKIDSGLEPEEIIDLWAVVFPNDEAIEYDEISDNIIVNNVSGLSTIK